MEGRLPREPKLQSEPMGAWLKKYTSSLLMELFPGTWLQEYSTMPRVLEILRNILYSIEYSYGSTEVSTIYPTFSIAYSIYSTSHLLKHANFDLFLPINCLSKKKQTANPSNKNNLNNEQ